MFMKRVPKDSKYGRQGRRGCEIRVALKRLPGLARSQLRSPIRPAATACQE
jgi:hypothetical protein